MDFSQPFRHLVSRPHPNSITQNTSPKHKPRPFPGFWLGRPRAAQRVSGTRDTCLLNESAGARVMCARQVDMCLVRAGGERPTAAALLAHEWVVNSQESETHIIAEWLSKN